MTRISEEELAALGICAVIDFPVKMDAKKLGSIVTELRERRTADLTNAEREALAMMRRDLGSSTHFDEHAWYGTALATLAKLLAQGEKP